MSGPSPEPAVRYEAELPPQLRRWVSAILRGGLILAASLLAVGLFLWAVQGAPVDAGAAAGGYTGDSLTLAAGISSGSAFAFLVLGLLVLVLTPIARVVVSLALFARVRDRPFVGLTAFVLLVLLASVCLAIFGVVL
jgi:uncharacterized membrane protein